MVKSKRRHLRYKTRKNKMYKKMKGGAYTPEQVQQLIDAGFTQQFVKIAYRGKIGFNVLFNDFQNSGKTVQQYMQDTYNDLGIEPDEGMTSGEEDSDQDGGKNKKHCGKKTRKNRKCKKGGTLYGRGYGANCNDPNYSIYNTNLLQLFPYSPK
jgi:hypothetical protein